MTQPRSWTLPLAAGLDAAAPGEPRCARSLLLRRALWVKVGLATAVLGLLCGFLAFSDWATREPSGPDGRTEAIVAMTGGSERVSDAVGLLGQGHGRRLLISGVHPMVREREFARAVPRAMPFMACCIDLDHRALNTFGNAIETAKWVRLHAFRSVLVVTSNYHMPRTMLELKRVLPDVELVAHPVSTSVRRDEWWKDGPSLKILTREYAKYLMAVLRLRLDSPVADTRMARAAN